MTTRRTGTAVAVAVLIASVSALAYFNSLPRPNWSVSNLNFAQSGTYFAIGFNLTNESPFTLTSVAASVNGANIGNCDVNIAPNGTSYCDISGNVPSCASIEPLPVGKLVLTATFSGSYTSERDTYVTGSGCPAR